jgi:glycosyltransferase involved in cell wall biosynthesis
MYNIIDNVIFTGPLDEEKLSDLFLKTHVFVLPSAIENSSNSLSEAIEKVKLSGNKFERRNDKETLINSKYRYVNDWKKLNFVIPDTESKNNK